MTVLVEDPSMKVFEELESQVRSYSRSFPTVFNKSKGYKLWDIEQREYIDFFAGAGTLNYGHNNDVMKKKLIEYIEDRKSTRLNSSHVAISYAVFCLKKKNNKDIYILIL